MTTCETSILTPNDTAVLSALFDPESSPSASSPILKTLRSLPSISDSTLLYLQSQEIAAIQSLSGEQPSHSSIRNAISNLSSLIAEHPKYAPAYLNRAQATRLLISTGSEATLFLRENRLQISSILTDLNKTVSLASPSTPEDSISELQVSLLSKAHTHRGYLLLKASQAINQPGSSSFTLPAELADLDGEQLEEMASKDFLLGGRYGNKIARELSVKTNPYAKMCGAIVKEAMRREREEYEMECV